MKKKERSVVEVIAQMSPDSKTEYNDPDTGATRVSDYKPKPGRKCASAENNDGKSKKLWSFISSGFFVQLEDKPYVLTCAHSVPSNRLSLEILHCMEGEYDFSAHLVFLRKQPDLALLGMDYTAGFNFQFLNVDAGPPPPIGMDISSIGHPQKLAYSGHLGQIGSSGTRKIREFRRDIDVEIDFHPNLDVLQINNMHGQGGSSGGPIFDASGNLIGVESFILFGYDFAIPVSLVREFLDEFLHFEKAKKEQVKEKKELKKVSSSTKPSKKYEKPKQGGKRPFQSSSSQSRPAAKKRDVKSGCVTHPELAEECLLNSLKSKIVQHSFSNAAYVNDLKEAEQFLWAAAEMDPEVRPRPFPLFLNGSPSTSNPTVASMGDNPDLAYLHQGSQKSASEKLAIVKISCEDDSITNDGISSEEPPMNAKDHKENVSTKLSKDTGTGNNQNECERVPIEYLCQKEEVSIETRLTEQSTKSVKGNACVVHKEALGRHHNLEKPLKPKKKAMKLRIANIRLGPGSLMKTSLNQYKKKNKWRSLKFKINIQDNVEENSNSVGLDPSTSENSRMTELIVTHCKRRLKKSSAQNGSGSKISKDVRNFEEDSVSNVMEGCLRKRMYENNAALAIDEPPRDCSSLISAAQCDSREPDTSQMERGLFEDGFMTRCSDFTSLQMTSVVSTLSQGLRIASSEAPTPGYTEIKSKPSVCSSVSMDYLETLYARAKESPMYVEECGRSAGENVEEISSAKGWINSAKQCVSAKPPTKIEVDDLHTLKLQMLESGSSCSVPGTGVFVGSVREGRGMASSLQ